MKVVEASPPTTATSLARWFLYLKSTVPPETGAPVESLVTVAVKVCVPLVLRLAVAGEIIRLTVAAAVTVTVAVAVLVVSAVLVATTW